MRISFADDAFDAFVRQVASIPEEYTVALLADGQPLPNSPDLTPGIDVRFVSADHDGIDYELLDSTGEPTGETGHKNWADVAEVHVY